MEEVKEKMTEKISLQSKILELHQNSNDIYMSLNMCILSNQVNLNNAKFTDEFINGVVENKDTYIGIPLCVNKFKLESGMYSSLSHEFDKTSGQLKTQIIGSFGDYWTETDEDGTLKLMGSAKVFKRYPKVCEAIIELYGSDDLEMSCEVLVNGYESVDGDVRSIGYEYEGNINYFIGSALVSDPAETRSRATLLIAEALDSDFKGVEEVSETVKTEIFNKGIEIKYCVDIETSSLKWSEVSSQIYGILNPIDLKNNYRKYNYYIQTLYNDHVIVEEYDDYETLWKIGYQIVNNSVVLDDKEKWIQGKLGFIPNNVSIDTLLAEKESLTIEINNKIAELNSQHKEEKKVTEEQIKELQSKLEELSTKVTELESTIVSQAETIKSQETKEAELASEVETLKPFKEQVEVAEKQAKKNVIIEKFSKLLSKEVMESEVVVAAIDALDEVSLNSVVVEQVSKELAAKQTEKTEMNKEDVVVVTARKQEDLLPTSKKDYWASVKSV